MTYKRKRCTKEEYKNHLSESGRVFRDFLLSTLDISNGKFKRTCVGAKEIGITMNYRRECEGATPTPKLQKQSVRHHIYSYQKYTSHFSSRYNLVRNTFHSSKEMCKLYVGKCKEENITCVKKWQYHYIYKNESEILSGAINAVF
jgi:hypothetical protein